ncbi:MAG: hypothetical protein Q7U37_04765 [Gallionella sp.]|nr:hypothetical protein [Gallionella sp.]
MNSRRRFLIVAVVMLLAGCAGLHSAPVDPARAEVDRLFGRLQQDLRSDNWTRIGWAFSPGARDISSARNSREERWVDFQTVDVSLMPGRILERDGLMNVQVRWNRLVRNRNGQFIKSAGTAEVILEKFRNEYRIRQILGDSFL